MDTEKYYIDENKKYKFEFANFNVYEYHELAQETTILSDVDFVIDMQDKLLLVEYKNAMRKEWCEFKPEEIQFTSSRRLEKLYNLLKDEKLQVRVLPNK